MKSQRSLTHLGQNVVRGSFKETDVNDHPSADLADRGI